MGTVEWKRPHVLGGALLGSWLVMVAMAATVHAGTDVRRDAVVAAVAKVMPSVVNIATETLVPVNDPWDQMWRQFWGPYYRRRPATAQYSLGSGVIIDEHGYVLTNDHVVRRANRIWVKLTAEAGGKEYEAKLIRGDARTDIALLRIEAKPGTRFKAAQFAADDDLLLGETVLALGNPFGLGGSVTRGILSSKSRRPPVAGAPLDLADWLQTDAAINPGNSGGPLVDIRGEVIGLNVAVFREGQGIGFAIPIKRVMQALTGVFSPALSGLWFGAQVRPDGSELVVAHVEEGSPAARAGLKRGDKIVSVNGEVPAGYIDFIRRLDKAGDHADIRLVVQRGKTQPTLTLQLVEEASVFNAALIRRRLGVGVQVLTPALANRLGVAGDQGLLVNEVESGSAAGAAGLQPGDILLSIDGNPIPDVITAAKYLYRQPRGETVTVSVLVSQQQGNLLITSQAKVNLQVR